MKKLGPGVLVAAAFIGPGTVTTCTLAGTGFGFTLLWAILLSTLATIILQEMAARVGLVTQKGLAEVILKQTTSKWARILVVTIVLSAILIGNVAYEGGNISGGVLGLEALFGKSIQATYPFIIGGVAFVLLWAGSYKFLERIFVGLVLIMSLSFLVTAIMTAPNLLSVVKGMFTPNLSGDNLLMVIALVGTTVVPYNLFLHAALVNEKWGTVDDLAHARWDTFLSIALGGIVSAAIVVCAAAIPTTDITSALDLAKGLEPLYGRASRYFLGIGLFAAGITSAITAPLAAAYVVQQCFGWQGGTKTMRFRIVWLLVLVIGVLSLSFNARPIEIIRFAQIANGILLPFIAIFLMVAVNQKPQMQHYANNKIQNTIGALIIVLTLFLGIKSVLKVLTTL